VDDFLTVGVGSQREGAHIFNGEGECDSAI